MLDQDLKRLLNNEIDGSTKIFLDVLQYIIKFDPELHIKNKSLIENIQRITETYKEMRLIQQFGEDIKGLSVNQIMVLAKKRLETHKNELQQIHKNLTQYIQSHKIQAILTYSNSYTIESCLCAYEDKNLPIYISKSEPENEGLALFEALENFHNRVLVNHDEAIDCLNQRFVDLLLLGCDLFTDTHLVNKRGSYELIKIARENNIPVVFICSTRKRADAVVIKNPIFESIKKEAEFVFILDH